ncbi:MAG: methyltransferase domain-containing protein [Acidobacteria bacterium]|nr:methyltransferase domain-containing protein [Acidobacteriota bacterium]
MLYFHVRRLRKLQRAYYDAQTPDGAVILEYLQALAELRKAFLGTNPPRVRALHAGSGMQYLPGWINVDIDRAHTIDVAGDLAISLPFRDASLDYIHSEDFLEHLDFQAGKRFLRECRRVLKRSGVMRLLTPDLRRIIERVYVDRDERHLRWCGSYLDASSPAEALNMHLRMHGEHRFLYDEELLTETLREIGFAVRSVSWNASRERFLRFLDLRDFGLSQFLECRPA